LLDVNSQANHTKPARRKILLWKRADLYALHCSAVKWAEDYVNKFSSLTGVGVLKREMRTAV